MDRLRRLTKSKSSDKNDQGGQCVRQEKSKLKLPSSSLVARFMGFDGLKSKQAIHRQHKSFVEHNFQKTSPVAQQGDAHLVDGESHKKRFTEQSECRDIFEDKSGSNRDAILKLLKKPNPVFVKHLQDVQESSSRSACSNLTTPKQSDPEKYQAKDQNVRRSTSKRQNIDLKQTYENAILNRSFTPESTQNPQPSKIGGEDKEATYEETSGIVILEPDYRMAQDACNSFLIHDPLRANFSGSRKSKGKLIDRAENEDFLETLDFVDGVAVSASRFREANKIAKKVVKDLSETTQTMKETKSKEAAKRINGEVQEVFSRMRRDFPLYVKEIPGTGGLHDLSGIDSASESVVMKMTSYDSTDSFISRLAKKRLLDRWRRAQRYEHARAGGKSSTLGEMLRTPEERMKNLNAASARGDSPLGISSADGWKDKFINIKPRSKSLPPPGTGNVNVNAESQDRTDDKLLMFKEDSYQSKSEVQGNFNEHEASCSKTSRSSKRKSKSRHRRASNSCALLESHKVSLEEKPMVPPTPTVTASFVSSDACYPDFSRSMLKRCDTSRGVQEHSNPKLLGAEAGSSAISKKADPSPYLALEVPSREDVSSVPECLKQVSADLHDLRKQLTLLRRESKSNFDDSPGERSRLELDANELVGSECWESFYIADVLTECGLYDMDTDTLMPGSNGPNRPLGPWVFHKLETKYCDETSAPKYERMLLFDRIRSTVLEISQSCMNQCPWVKPVSAEFGLKWPKCKLRNELHKLLAIQDAEVIELFSGKVIDKVTYWGDLRNSVDMIGKIIERSLTNDLLMELVTELQFDM